MIDGDGSGQDRKDVWSVGSSRRNPIVADVFGRLAYAERRGSWLRKIFDSYDDGESNQLNRKPRLESGAFFTVVLPNLTYGMTKEALVAHVTNGGRVAVNEVVHLSRPPNSNHPQQSTPNSRPIAVKSPCSQRRGRGGMIERGLMRVLIALDVERGSSDLLVLLGLRNRADLYTRFLLPAMNQGLIEYTIPDKPNSRLQKYRLTPKGKAMLKAASPGAVSFWSSFEADWNNLAR